MYKTLPQRGVGYSTLNSIENGMMILPDQTRNPNYVNNLEAYLRYGPMSTITNAGLFFFHFSFPFICFRALWFLFIFNWRIVILQCCFGFCHMST